MDRGTKPYLLVHYVLLIGIILVIVGLAERSGVNVPLWGGVLVAIGIGLLYPRLVASIGVAPEGWE